MSQSSVVKPSLEELLPIYQELLPREKIKELAKQSKVKLYWRLLTPLVMVWGFIYQRLSADHSCDGFVSHLHTGQVDQLDPLDKHSEPLSKRLKSESSSAYCQARKRLPLSLLQGCLSYVSQEMVKWLTPSEGELGCWKGLAVRYLDGTTYRLRPFGDLVTTYGQASNQYGPSYWVVVRSLAAFCMYTQAVVSYTEGPMTQSEASMIHAVMKADPIKHTVYIGDQGLGIYRTVQIANYNEQFVLLRVTKSRFQSLQKRNHLPRSLKPGEQAELFWTPTAKDQPEPELPKPAIRGRAIYARIEKDGFRPLDIYLFTTLIEDDLYPIADVVQLYGQRLRVEIDYRQVKTTLEMEQFEVKSADMFRKELAAGLLTYNLVCALMVKAAQIGQILPVQLSFARCYRRIRDMIFQGIPRWLYLQNDIQTVLLKRLAQCKLPTQPNKVRYEPRKVRRKPPVFPPLKGDRNVARKEFIDSFNSLPNS